MALRRPAGGHGRCQELSLLPPSPSPRDRLDLRSRRDKQARAGEFVRHYAVYCHPLVGSSDDALFLFFFFLSLPLGLQDGPLLFLTKEIF